MASSRTCGLLLLVLAFLAYLPATGGGFIWDDAEHLTENPCIVGPLGLAQIWTSVRASNCPLVLTTFWLEHRLWGLEPWPYHAVNILMHAAAALVLWRVLLRLGIPGAWLGAALWALHPVQAESVAWITELKNTQSALFFLLSILFFCRSRQSQSGDGQQLHRGFHYGLALLFGLFAMASKSSTVVLPLMLWLCAWWLERSWNWRRNLLQLAPLFLMSVLAGALTMVTQELRGEGLGSEWALDGFQRVAVAGSAIWFYLGKLVWPHPLMTIYPRWEITSSSVLTFLPAIAALAVSVLLWRNRNAWNGLGRGLLLAWACFILALLPVLGLVDHDLLAISFVFDHFQYLASMGPLALAGAGISAALSSWPGRSRRLMVAACPVALLVLGCLSWTHCAVYETQESLWTASLRSNPTCWVAHNNLGIVLGQKGRPEEAMEHFQKAIEVRPLYAEAHNNLGMALGQMDRSDEAMMHFQKALEIGSSFGEAHYNLGVQLQMKGQDDAALGHLQKAVEGNADFAEGQNNLGLAFQRKGNLDEALAHYWNALRLRPDYAEAHNNLGSALGQRGQVREALEHFQRAVAIDPDFAEARENVGRALQNQAAAASQKPVDENAGSAEAHNKAGIACGQKGQMSQAVAQFRQALALKADFAEAHYNLGFALQRMGQPEEALAQYEEAIQDKPDYAAALRGLAYLLSASNQASLRDGVKAVELARRANELTGGRDPVVLGTLAAAQAESQSYPEAMETVQRAIQLAETQGLTSLASVLHQHLRNYQSGHPLRGVQ